MAYASALPEEKFNVTYDELYARSAKAARAAYEVKLASAKTAKQRAACSGCYPSDWSELLKHWTEDRISNIHVYDCLRVGYVLAH